MTKATESNTTPTATPHAVASLVDAAFSAVYKLEALDAILAAFNTSAGTPVHMREAICLLADVAGDEAAKLRAAIDAVEGGGDHARVA